MNRLYAAGAVVVLVLSVVSGATAMLKKNWSLENELKTQQQVLENAKTARRVADASLTRQRHIAEAAQSSLEQLLTKNFGDCHDTILPDDLRDILNGRLPAEAGDYQP